MALGLTEFSGAAADTSLPAAGELEWHRMGGLSPEHPLVGGPRIDGLGAHDVDGGFSRIATLESTGAALGQLAGAPGVHTIDGFGDLLNFRGSPMPWMLGLALLALGVMQLQVAGRVGPLKASASAG